MNSKTRRFIRFTATALTITTLWCLFSPVSSAQTDRCTAPYLQMAGAGSPGNVPTDPTQGELTIQHVNIGEPFTTCTNNSVTFVMKVNNLDPGNTGQPVLPENAEWKFNFTVTTPDNVDHEIFVAMDTFVANNASTA